MAGSSNHNTVNTDLRYLPNITFSFVERYVEKNSLSSGQKNTNKGFTYYSEGYVHNIRTFKLDSESSRVAARCYHSMRKNESPHFLEVYLSNSKGDTILTKATCSCTIGQSGCCGHVVGLMYQLANYQALGRESVPVDVAKTSLPQTWHLPRGEKIKGQSVSDVVIHGQGKKEEARSLKSTLYNPIRGDLPDLQAHAAVLRSVDSSLLLLTIIPPEFPPNLSSVCTPLGHFVKGSPLSYQQKFHSDFIMNIFNAVPFPSLPLFDYMMPTYNRVLREDQHLSLSSLSISCVDSVQIETSTRLQSNEPRWHNLRKNRITASRAGEIYHKRDRKAYASKLKTGARRQGCNMQFGLDNESVAAQTYNEKKNKEVNIYPCGVVINPKCYWLAASPDRRVYDPTADPPFGLLEIKSVVAPNLSNVDYLVKCNDCVMLGRNKNHYYQIQMQLAVTGLNWCDFFVWSEQETHLERIQFNREEWCKIQANLDAFFFEFYL